jgi:hypothetical protein
MAAGRGLLRTGGRPGRSRRSGRRGLLTASAMPSTHPHLIERIEAEGCVLGRAGLSSTT